MKYASILSIILAVFVSPSAFSRPVALFSYEQLVEKSDIVVIATPTAVRDTNITTTFPGIQQDGQPVPATSMEADFQVLAVLKGTKKEEKIILHYLRSPDPNKIAVNGPMLVSFDPSEKNRYLLFLKRDENGRYSPVNSQTDPYFSVKNLGSTP